MITLGQIPPGHPGRRFLIGETVWSAVGADPRFSYGLYVPERFEPGDACPVIVVIHSTNRRAQDLRRSWSRFAERHGAAIVAPLFPAGVSAENDLDGYKAIENHGIRYDLVLFELLEEVALRWGLDVSRVYLTGHSGGGQFVARMLLLHPGKLAGAVVSAPGRITIIDKSMKWPAGTADTEVRFGRPVDAVALARVPTLLVVGENDEGTADLEAQNDASQDRHGATRVARLRSLAANLEANGADIRLEVVADAGHEGDPTHAAAERFLAELVGSPHS